MGREVRWVPVNWEHPKDKDGRHIPLLSSFDYNAEEVEEGLRNGWLDGEPPHYGIDVMPDWPARERTHLQMYETTSEGTPISPVMETPVQLARWLAENNASAFAGIGATEAQWFSMIVGGGSAVSAVMQGGRIYSGVEAVAEMKKEEA